MTQSRGPAHVYVRAITEGERTSLSVLTGWIKPQSRVLDLGTGSGALGQYLQEHKGCVVDGVTYNPAEQARAAAHYRRVEVADLDQCDLQALCGDERYDYIVCADVLEHLKQPERVLAAAKSLLLPEGMLLVSVPNGAYCGLIAELMSGEFLYREEGLLDSTHLRFFTRRSLLRFMRESHWHTARLETIHRPLPESEFHVAFDRLPPAVARYLQTLPDAMAYQLVLAAQPAQQADAEPDAALLAAEAGGEALFTMQLYSGVGGRYDEAHKLTRSGVIGRARQRIAFEIPYTAGRPIDSLRLDPADRPGFMRLHGLTLRSGSGAVVWSWDHERDGIHALTPKTQEGLLLAPQSPLADGGMALLYGDDPWFQLPVPPELVAHAAAGPGAMVVEVETSWPMSADYLSLAGPVADCVRDAGARVADARREAADTTAAQQAHFDSVLQRERSEHDASRRAAEAETLRQHELHRHRAETDHLALRTLTERQQFLEERNRLLLSQQRGLSHDNTLLTQQKNRFETERNQLLQHLGWIENSTVFRMTRPLVRAKMRWQALRNPAPAPGVRGVAERTGVPIPTPDHPVDVVVPVYKGLADTQRCIGAALSQACRTPMRLIVINDASPEPAVTAWLREAAARDERIVLLENAENLGFVGTVNRGMALSDSHDVLLLNSDTEVANDWLDRLRAAAYSDARVASVTPFSNNATICSYPRFCKDNTLPAGHTTQSLDALFAQVNAGHAIDVPTGVGFCMYIRRDALQAVGLFDAETFGKGYGEENDFCRRALARGWRNLHALDTFVMHAGGVSFGDAKAPREAAAVATLRKLYPDYDPEVQRFVAHDPAWLARMAVDVARIRARGLPVVVMVVHDRAGGTLRHVQELGARLAHMATFLVLSPAGGGAVRLELVGASEGFALQYQLPEQYEELVQGLQGLGTRHLHFHHLIGHGDMVRGLAQRLGVAYDFTAHDFYTMCPQISLTGRDNGYCGERGVAQCEACLEDAPAPGGVDITTWRNQHAGFVLGARHVLVPSRDAARRFARLLPQADIRLAPHLDMLGLSAPEPTPAPLAEDEPLRVVVIGALSAIKGADVLEAVARLAAQRQAPVEFHLVGYAYRHLKTQPAAALTVHGAYDEDDLPRLLAWLRPHVAWFPAQWPETYSYTLSACMQAGLPVVAPSIGAFGERLQGRPWTWLRDWNATPADTLSFFEDIRVRQFATGTGPARVWTAQQPDGADAVIGIWSYDAEYLAQLPDPLPAPAGQAGVDLAHLVQHHPERGGPLGTQLRRGAKRHMLVSLARLRTAPGLSHLARVVPLRWQTRLKNWLRA